MNWLGQMEDVGLLKNSKTRAISKNRSAISMSRKEFKKKRCPEKDKHVKSH